MMLANTKPSGSQVVLTHPTKAATTATTTAISQQHADMNEGIAVNLVRVSRPAHVILEIRLMSHLIPGEHGIKGGQQSHLKVRANKTNDMTAF